MITNGSGEYLRNAVLTASPEQLQLMLYDGAIRFARKGKDAMRAGNHEQSCEALIRAQRIVVQLQAGLQHDVNPDLCDQLSGLYSFIYDRLVAANMKRDESAIDEAMQILEHQRETWTLLIERLREPTPSTNAPTTRTDGGTSRRQPLSVEG